MKSLSLKRLSSKKSGFGFSDCFDTNASISSILYSRCLLYIVLLISLINLFYIINFQHMYSLIIFFLVGFVTSFFVKNMIIVILFATFVSLFFQSTVVAGGPSADPEVTGAPEGFEGMDDKEKGDEKKKDDDKKKDEGFKYSHQGEEADLEKSKSKENHDDKSKDDKSKDEKDGDKSSEKKTSKAGELKKNMEDYFAVQKELLSVLEKAEPLQEKAEALKEKFKSS